jgi:hypothetical protein
MGGFGRFKLSDAVSKSGGKASEKPSRSQRGLSKQAREADESRKAVNAMPTTRDRMVDIGRGNQQSGRQGGG